MTTRPSIRSLALRPRTFSASRSASRTRRSSAWRRTTARRPRCSRWRTASRPASAGSARRCGRRSPPGQWRSRPPRGAKRRRARRGSLASEFERAHRDSQVASFVAELAVRFSAAHSSRGVNLLTYHRAKGLEFDAVYLPHLVDGELPFRSGRARADPEEERRLLYVGITRARRSEEHTSELQSRPHLVCRLLLEKKKLQRLSCELRSQTC